MRCSPGRTRTCYPVLRRHVLYPDELRGRNQNLTAWDWRLFSILRPVAILFTGIGPRIHSITSSRSWAATLSLGFTASSFTVPDTGA